MNTKNKCLDCGGLGKDKRLLDERGKPVEFADARPCGYCGGTGEMQSKAREIYLAAKRALKAQTAILDHCAEWTRFNPGKPIKKGSCPCPNCFKRLHFGIAPATGHIAAACETPGCVNFRT